MSEPASRENFYPLKLPTELYLALIDRMSKTKLSKGDCLIDMLTETAYREGLLPEEHYRFLKMKYGTKTVLEKVLEGRNEKEEASVKVEVSSAKFEVQKSTIEVKKRIDYSKLTDDELLEAYRKAMLSNDVVVPKCKRCPIIDECNKNPILVNAPDRKGKPTISSGKTTSNK